MSLREETLGIKLAEMSDGKRGIWVFYHEKPPDDVPEYDKIQIVYEQLNPKYRKELWIHEEEALILVSGLSKGIFEILTRQPIREAVMQQFKKHIDQTKR